MKYTYDKKPAAIKYETSKIVATQKLINDLRVKLNKDKYNWTTDLEDNVSLAEVLNELTSALSGLESAYAATDCTGGVHYGSVRSSHETTYNGCSAEKSSVNTSDCIGGYKFDACNCYNGAKDDVYGSN